jgi:hypothetical protein
MDLLNIARQQPLERRSSWLIYIKECPFWV